MAKNKDFPHKEIEKTLGIKPKSESFYFMRKQNKILTAKLHTVNKLLDALVQTDEFTLEEIGKIKELLANFKVEIPKQFDVKVLNQVDIPDNFDVNNFPEFVKLFKPKWLNELSAPIVRELQDLRIAQAKESDLSEFTDRQNPIAVRISDGVDWLKAFREAQVVQGSTVDQETKDILNNILGAVGGSPGATIRKWGETLIGGGGSATLTTYTVPVGKSYSLNHVSGSAGTDGIWKLEVNGTEIWKARNAWTNRNVGTNVSYDAVAGDVIDLIADNEKNTNHLFNGGFDGEEI